jgi:hypothetical protein
MDRKTNQDGSSFHPGEVAVNLQFTAGTSGAVPAFTVAGWRRAGIASVVLSGTSDYTVTFQDSYVSLISKTIEIDQATFDKTHAGMGTVKPADILVSSNPATIKITTRSTDGNGTAAALTVGDVFRARFVLAKLQGNG